MSESGEKILELLNKGLPQMSEAEKERLLWFTEGFHAAAMVQITGQDSA